MRDATVVGREPLVAEGRREGHVLELRGVSKAYRRGVEMVPALAGADLEVSPGELVALVGRSGSGKSTLLHIAGGLDLPDDGEVTILGRDPTAMSTGERAGLRREAVGFVFQFFHLLPQLTVIENVELPLLLTRSSETRSRARKALESVELAGRERSHPPELSGGEMQRVAIARALVTGAPLILADEPTGNLDSVTAAGVLDLLAMRVRESGAALVLATHDPAAASRADRVLRLADGRLLAEPHG